MTKLVILSAQERRRFDSPPHFNVDERTINFNKFAKAVFFANNQEFKQGTKEDQEIAAACMVLIQNSIVLWNYLYLSELLANNADNEQRKQMISSIKHGSVITWQHINLHGEYDFTKHAANDVPFDMNKIMSLNIG